MDVPPVDRGHAVFLSVLMLILGGFFLLAGLEGGVPHDWVGVSLTLIGLVGLTASASLILVAAVGRAPDWLVAVLEILRQLP